jgi:hypothetical protein
MDENHEYCILHTVNVGTRSSAIGFAIITANHRALEIGFYMSFNGSNKSSGSYNKNNSIMDRHCYPTFYTVLPLQFLLKVFYR